MAEIKRPKPIVLVIMDGWGITQPYSGNAISQANTPNVDGYISKYPSMTLRASGEAVGLPWGESGNSEVGHMNIGLGRILYQDLPKINKAIADNVFYDNEILLKAINHAKKNKSSLHLMGLVSNGGIHSSIEHLEALLALMQKEKFNNFFIHAFLDGRDTPYNSGINFIKQIEKNLSDYGQGAIATLSGRFYAMDRDNHWDRIEKVYRAMVFGEGNRSASAVEAIQASYDKKIYDEEFVPTVIEKNGQPVARVKAGDAIIFFNFRADRARQITKAFSLPGLEKFNRGDYLKDFLFVCFTEYEKKLPAEVAFPTEIIEDTLGEIISKNGLKQLRIAETEKYAHVTYFFNGGREDKMEGEEHVLVPSPQVASYDMKPEMSAPELTSKLLKAIESDNYDFILVNYANPDMVGHTGNFKAAIRAIEAVDVCVGKLVKAVLGKDGMIFLTADHGNAEVMFNMQTGMIDKEHTSNPVPFIAISKELEGKNAMRQDAPGGDLSLLAPQGILSDIAPTILQVMGLPKPQKMSGRSLI